MNNVVFCIQQITLQILKFELKLAKVNRLKSNLILFFMSEVSAINLKIKNLSHVNFNDTVLAPKNKIFTYSFNNV